MTAGGDHAVSFTGILEPYLDMEGVRAVALVSREGLLVASTGSEEYDFQSLGAYAAATLSQASDLAGELGSPPPLSVSLNLSRQGLVLAPLNRELFLVLAGARGILALAAGDTVLP
ncbi:MAG TPA: roadblock/LC7 domain-containing protein [Actinobacteria bacterium]|nr:roadblock/LC7 domain-containing protein [Actinomycetota bacterium]